MGKEKFVVDNDDKEATEIQQLLPKAFFGCKWVDIRPDDMSWIESTKFIFWRDSGPKAASIICKTLFKCPFYAQDTFSEYFHKPPVYCRAKSW